MAYPASVSTTLLRNVPLFAGLDETQLKVLARVIVRTSFGRNTTIIRAGDPTDSLYIVINGRGYIEVRGRSIVLHDNILLAE